MGYFKNLSIMHKQSDDDGVDRLTIPDNFDKDIAPLIIKASLEEAARKKKIEDDLKDLF